MTTIRRLGLLGGTFDPIHRGHLDTLRAAQPAFGWDCVIVIPAWRQPFKTERRSASAFHRYAMAALAVQDEPLVRVSPDELERGEISYTVDTLENFRSRERDAVIDWIIGDDNLAQLPAWKSLDRIFELANFAVLRRDAGTALPPPLRARERSAEERGAAGAIVFADNAVRAISATGIRDRIRSGRAVDELVDPRVARYIEQHRLYQGEA